MLQVLSLWRQLEDQLIKEHVQPARDLPMCESWVRVLEAPLGGREGSSWLCAHPTTANP